MLFAPTAAPITMGDLDEIARTAGPIHAMRQQKLLARSQKSPGQSDHTDRPLADPLRAVARASVKNARPSQTGNGTRARTPVAPKGTSGARPSWPSQQTVVVAEAEVLDGVFKVEAILDTKRRAGQPDLYVLVRIGAGAHWCCCRTRG